MAASFFVGQIFMGAWNYEILGAVYCRGQEMAINQYSALFSLLGTIYGGDGRKNFKLPDLQGRFPMHQGTGNGLSPRVVGSKGGQPMTRMLPQHLPIHTHKTALAGSFETGDSSSGTSNNPAGHWLGPQNIATSDGLYRAKLGTGSIKGGQGIIVDVGETGNGHSFYITNQFVGMNFFIALYGVFPSRG